MGIQARVRGFIARLAFGKNIRRLVICQNLVRKYLAKKELKELKIEAMNTTGIETTTAPVSHPTCQVIQTPCALHKEVKHGLEPKPMVPLTRYQCSCRVCITLEVGHFSLVFLKIFRNLLVYLLRVFLGFSIECS